jgi:hypothetical protein
LLIQYITAHLNSLLLNFNSAHLNHFIARLDYFIAQLNISLFISAEANPVVVRFLGIDRFGRKDKRRK